MSNVKSTTCACLTITVHVPPTKSLTGQNDVYCEPIKITIPPASKYPTCRNFYVHLYCITLQPHTRALQIAVLLHLHIDSAMPGSLPTLHTAKLHLRFWYIYIEMRILFSNTAHYTHLHHTYPFHLVLYLCIPIY